MTAVLKIRFTVLLAVLLAFTAAHSSFAQMSNLINSAKATALVDVNSADLTTLQNLPGVGPTIAKRIVDGRPYQSLSDLVKVKGLSDSKVNAMKNMLVFGSATNSVATNMVMGAQSKMTGASNLMNQTAGSITNSRTTMASMGHLAPGQTLNINTASATDLDKLPGIGPTKAKAIVDYRTTNGNFTTIEDLQKVKGIKADTFAKLKDFIKVSN